MYPKSAIRVKTTILEAHYVKHKVPPVTLLPIKASFLSWTLVLDTVLVENSDRMVFIRQRNYRYGFCYYCFCPINLYFLIHLAQTTFLKPWHHWHDSVHEAFQTLPLSGQLLINSRTMGTLHLLTLTHTFQNGPNDNVLRRVERIHEIIRIGDAFPGIF